MSKFRKSNTISFKKKEKKGKLFSGKEENFSKSRYWWCFRRMKIICSSNQVLLERKSNNIIVKCIHRMIKLTEMSERQILVQEFQKGDVIASRFTFSSPIIENEQS